MPSPTASSILLLASVALFLNAVPADAATLTSSTFTSVGLAGTQDIAVTGPDVVDWGYYTKRSDFYQNTVRVHTGHLTDRAQAPRVLNMNYTVTAADGNLSGNTVSNGIPMGQQPHMNHEIVFSTSDPNALLTLQLNSTSGGSGSGWIGG